jgi:hypothetical protein
MIRIEEDLKEPPAGAWLELANGGGVMFRDGAQLLRAQPPRYERRRKQLLGADDEARPL